MALDPEKEKYLGKIVDRLFVNKVASPTRHRHNITDNIHTHTNIHTSRERKKEKDDYVLIGMLAIEIGMRQTTRQQFVLTAVKWRQIVANVTIVRVGDRFKRVDTIEHGQRAMATTRQYPIFTTEKKKSAN